MLRFFSETNESPLTNQPKDAKMWVGNSDCHAMAGTPMNLDNANSCAQPLTAQIPFEYTTSDGCHVKLTFRKESKPGVREEIARLLLDAFEERVRRQ